MAKKIAIVKRVQEAARLQKKAKTAGNLGIPGRAYVQKLNRKQVEVLIGKEALNAMFRVPRKHSFGNGWDLCPIGQSAPYSDLSVRRMLVKDFIELGVKFSPGTDAKLLSKHGPYVSVKILPSPDLMANPGLWNEAREAAEQFTAALQFPKGIRIIRENWKEFLPR
ncbi:MAG: hypothetical protein NT067_01895 [Candidatus Diapherotrites archaeon]|nr:hypothetical protein [Candidatus Diapherotrites archaeon]